MNLNGSMSETPPHGRHEHLTVGAARILGDDPLIIRRGIRR